MIEAIDSLLLALQRRSYHRVEISQFCAAVPVLAVVQVGVSSTNPAAPVVTCGQDVRTLRSYIKIFT